MTARRLLVAFALGLPASAATVVLVEGRMWCGTLLGESSWDGVLSAEDCARMARSQFVSWSGVTHECYACTAGQAHGRTPDGLFGVYNTGLVEAPGTVAQGRPLHTPSAVTTVVVGDGCGYRGWPDFDRVQGPDHCAQLALSHNSSTRVIAFSKSLGLCHACGPSLHAVRLWADPAFSVFALRADPADAAEPSPPFAPPPAAPPPPVIAGALFSRHLCGTLSTPISRHIDSPLVCSLSVARSWYASDRPYFSWSESMHLCYACTEEQVDNREANPAFAIFRVRDFSDEGAEPTRWPSQGSPADRGPPPLAQGGALAPAEAGEESGPSTSASDAARGARSARGAASAAWPSTVRSPPRVLQPRGRAAECDAVTLAWSWTPSAASGDGRCPVRFLVVPHNSTPGAANPVGAFAEATEDLVSGGHKDLCLPGGCYVVTALPHANCSQDFRWALGPIQDRRATFGERVCMTGAAVAPELMALMEARVDSRWTLANVRQVLATPMTDFERMHAVAQVAVLSISMATLAISLCVVICLPPQDGPEPWRRADNRRLPVRGPGPGPPMGPTGPREPWAFRRLHQRAWPELPERAAGAGGGGDHRPPVRWHGGGEGQEASIARLL